MPYKDPSRRGDKSKWRLNPANKAKENAERAAYGRKHNADKQAYKKTYQLLINERKMGRRKPEVCDICGGSASRINFDHCHKHGHPRGWLCTRCNNVLGFVDDNTDLLRKMIAYLDRHANYQSPQLTLPSL